MLAMGLSTMSVMLMIAHKTIRKGELVDLV